MTSIHKPNSAASLRTSISQIFNDAQKPNANHRKYSIALRKLQAQSCLLSPIVENEPHEIDFDGESEFDQEFFRNVNKILTVKKREPHADRIVRFIAAFLQYTQQQDVKEAEESEDMEGEETISSRFVEHLMRHLIKGLMAKNKTVRLRSCQVVALSVNSQELKRALFERIRDKEASVRSQAATALSRLQSADSEVDEVDGKTITQKLVWALRHDPSAEVRRVVLFNLDQTDETIPYIVERARDADATNRRVVYLKPMAEIQDFRSIPCQERHLLLKCGLNDRDPMVKKAASKMISMHWIRHADHNLLEFLERMDILEGDAAEDILSAFLSSRIDIVNSIKFDDQFWNNLSPESSFLAKVLIQFLQAKEYDEKLDAVLPEVTRLSFITQDYAQLWRKSEKGTKGDYEFIVTQLLDIAKCLDYADEVGRRKMFDLLRDLIMVPDVSDNHLASVVELFKIISFDERDFTRTMVEIISDIQEVSGLGDQDSPYSVTDTPLKKIKLSNRISPKLEEDPDREPDILKKKLAQLKCLTICKHILERSEESLQNNSTLYGLLNELIVPSVKSNETVLLEEGLHCLGLFCCLDKTLGLHNLRLLTHLLKKGHLELQQKSLMILFDMLTCYGLDWMVSGLDGLDEVKDIFERSLDHDDPDMQAIAAQGLAKLMLSRIYQDKDILKLLVLLYFFPSTIDNTTIQQCLSYFFPAYCYSSPVNQKMMAEIAVEALEDLCSTFDDLDENEKMAPPSQIADMLVDWTEPRKVVKTRRNEDYEDGIRIQVGMALELLDIILKQAGRTRKIMCHTLNKMYIDEATKEQLCELLDKAKLVESDNGSLEPVVRNMLLKFMKSVEKRIPEDRDNREDQETFDENEEDTAVLPVKDTSNEVDMPMNTVEDPDVDTVNNVDMADGVDTVVAAD